MANNMLEQLRALQPGLKDVPDQVLAEQLYAIDGDTRPFEVFAKGIGYDAGDNFVRGAKIAGRNTLGALGGFAALGADQVGWQGAKDATLGFANDQFQRAGQMSRRSDDVDNIAEDPWATIAGGAGQIVGYAAPSLLTGGAGAVAGGFAARGLGAAAVRTAAIRGGIAGSGLNNIAQEAGSIYPDMIKEGHDDSSRALGYGAVAGALDTVPEMIGLGRIMSPGFRFGSRSGAALKQGAMQAGMEATTEIGQTAIEREAAYKDLLSDDAMKEYRNAGFLGAMGGGAFGAIGGVRTPSALGMNTPYDAGQMGQFSQYDSANAGAMTPYDAGQMGQFSQMRAPIANENQSQFDLLNGDAARQVDPRLAAFAGPVMPEVGQQFDQRTADLFPGTNGEMFNSTSPEIPPLTDFMDRRGYPMLNDVVDAQGNPVQRDLFTDPAIAPTNRVAPPTGYAGANPQANAALEAAAAEGAQDALTGQMVKGPRQNTVLTPDQIAAEDRVASAMGAAKQQQSLLTPGADPAAAPGGIDTGTSILDAQLAAMRKQATGGLLTPIELALASAPLQQVNPAAKVEPVQSSARTANPPAQGDLFGAPLTARGASTVPTPAASPAPTVTQKEAGQGELIDFTGKPTYAAEQGVEATDQQVAEQFGKLVGIKVTPNRTPAMAAIGRMNNEGAISEDDVSQVAEAIRAGKMAQAMRTIKELQAAATAGQQTVAPTQENANGNEETSSTGQTTQAEQTEEKGPEAEVPVPGVQVIPAETAAVEVSPSANADLEVEDGAAAPDTATDDNTAKVQALGEQYRTLKEKLAPGGKLVTKSGQPRSGKLAQYNELNDQLDALDDEARALSGVKLDDEVTDSGDTKKDAATKAKKELGSMVSDPVTEWNEVYSDEGDPTWDEFKKGDPTRAAVWVAAVEDGVANQNEFDQLVVGYKNNKKDRERSAAMRRVLDDQASFRTADEPRTGKNYISVKDAKAVVAALVKAWKNAPPIEVVANIGGLPADVRTQIEKDGVRPKGVYYQGKVWLVADNHTGAGDIVTSVLHEVTGHHGLRGLLGNAYSTVMRQIYNSNPDVRKLADPMIKSEKLSLEAAVEEVLADMAEKGRVKPSILEKIGNVIRAIMRRVGLGEYAVGYNNAEVKELLASARKFIEKGAPADTASVQNAVATPEASYRTADATDIPDLPPAASTFAKMMDGVKDLGTSTLWALTLRQIADRFGHIPAMKTYADLMFRMGSAAKRHQGPIAEIDRMLKKLGKPGAENTEQVRTVMSLMLEARLAEAHVDQEFRNEDKTNDHIDEANKDEFDALQARYNALSKEQKEIYQATKAKFSADWAENSRLLHSRIVDQYRDALGDTIGGKPIEEVAKIKDSAERQAAKQLLKNAHDRKVLGQLFDDIDTHAYETSQLKGPYFPLMRFGDHVVVMKSDALLAASKVYDDAKSALQAAYKRDIPDEADVEATAAYKEDLKATKKAAGKAKAEVDRLKGIDKNYVVEFFESKTEARNRAEQLRQWGEQQGMKNTVEQSLREEHFRQLDTPSFGFMQRLTENVAANLPSKDASAVQSAIRQLYIQSMPERSAMKSQLRHLGVSGTKVDEMRRAIVAAGMRNSFHLSRLEFGAELSNALTDLRHGKSDDEKKLGAEMSKRLLDSLTGMDRSNKVIDAASNMTYVTMLGLSPSFLALNLAQPWTVSAPLLMGRHGPAKTGKALGAAMLEVGAAMYHSWQAQGTVRFNLDMTKFSADEQTLLQNLLDKGIIDVSQEHELGATASGRSENFTDVLANWSAVPAHQTEVLNRVATALAAYRLQKSSGDTAANATAYAEKIVAESHMDYTPENAPRMMRPGFAGGLGKLIWQFKKYQQGMIYLHFKLLRDAIKEGKVNSESAKSLYYLLGAQVATAGAAGTAFQGLLTGAAAVFGALFGDDDEDKEYKERIYLGMKSVLGETAARAVMKGLPAAVGLDISSRIGQGDLLNPLKFAKDGKTVQDDMAYSLFSLAGPAFSMTANWGESIRQLYTTGDVVASTKAALPKVIGGPLAAYDMAQNGLMTKRGNQFQTPEDIGMWDIIATASTFKSTRVSDLQSSRFAFETATATRDAARDALLDRYSKATTRGDDMSGLMEKIADWNEKYPEKGVRIDQKTLHKSRIAQRNYQRELRDGVRVQKKDRALADEMGIE